MKQGGKLIHHIYYYTCINTCFFVLFSEYNHINNLNSYWYDIKNLYSNIVTCDVKGLKPTKSYILICNVIANKKWYIRLQANIKNTNKKLHIFNVSPFSNCKYKKKLK